MIGEVTITARRHDRTDEQAWQTYSVRLSEFSRQRVAGQGGRTPEHEESDHKDGVRVYVLRVFAAQDARGRDAEY